MNTTDLLLRLCVIGTIDKVTYKKITFNAIAPQILTNECFSGHFSFHTLVVYSLFCI